MSKIAYSTGSKKPNLAQGVLRLYSMRFCPFAKRVRLVLAYKNIPYETVNIDLQKKPEWFLAEFPSGQVPAVQWKDNKLNDSIVISDYLDAAYPKPQLHPEDPYLKAKDQLLLSAFSKISQCFYVYKLLTSSHDEIQAMIQPAIPLLQDLNDELKKRGSKFFGGSVPGMLDFMIWPWFDMLIVLQPVIEQIKFDDILPQGKCSSLQNWMKNMLIIPAVNECDNHAHNEQFYRLMKEGTIDPNIGL